MCIIAFAYQTHPDFPLILIGNRDEFYKRPTMQTHWWDDNVLAGKDLEAGGTWLGITRSGRFATLTNYRDIPGIKANARSRGELVSDFLQSSKTPRGYLSEISKKDSDYNGFNLLLWEKGQMLHYSNYEHMINEVKPGIHGLSNALLDTSWPKINKLVDGFERAIQAGISEKNLFDLLLDETKAEERDLPETGLPRDREKAISSICIRTPDYGTVSSTIVRVNKHKEVTFIEKTYPIADRKEQIQTFKWQLG